MYNQISPAAAALMMIIVITAIDVALRISTTPFSYTHSRQRMISRYVTFFDSLVIA